MTNSFISLAYGEKFANDVELFKDGVKKIMDNQEDFFKKENLDIPDKVYNFNLDSKELSISDELPDHIKQLIKECFLGIFG